MRIVTTFCMYFSVLYPVLGTSTLTRKYCRVGEKSIHELRECFGEQSEVIYAIAKNCFGVFKNTLDEDQFHAYICDNIDTKEGKEFENCFDELAKLNNIHSICDECLSNLIIKKTFLHSANSR
ncbi:uncharacterized protein [Centruroides vittatus]|uniref:uncharacterized protein n=1 Tax=Centruroides vittatus TaxID=120091 RepID=UPI003510865D